MRADNSIHIVTAAKQRHELTRAKAVADHAGVSRSWLYTQPDLKDEINRIRAQYRPQHDQAPPTRQRATEDSLRQRLDVALRRNRELAEQNQRLRHQLAHALGQARDDTPKRPAQHRDSITIDPR